MPTGVVNDSHCHFFSQQFFETLAAEPEARPTCNSAGDLLRKLEWDPPGSAAELADRWVAELDASGVSCAAIMSSVPGDEASVALAVKRHPKRLVGMGMLDITQADAPTRALRALTEYGLRCLCLFPAMHGYALDDERVAALFQIAAEHRAMVFVHCGVLSVGVRKKLGLRHCFDARLGNPLALVPVASKYPEVPVIVPHFGGGFLRETLMAGDVCSSLHVDTSSSNSWTKYIPGLQLADVFRQALEVFSADRLLFGSDSSFFPRGWQRPIYEHQLSVMDELELDPKTQERILGGNFTRLFGP